MLSWLKSIYVFVCGKFLRTFFPGYVKRRQAEYEAYLKAWEADFARQYRKLQNHDRKNTSIRPSSRTDQ